MKPCCEQLDSSISYDLFFSFSDELEEIDKRGVWDNRIRLVKKRSPWDNRIRLAKKGWDSRIRLAKKWDNRIRLAKKWDNRIRLAKRYMDWDKRIRLAKKSNWDNRIRLVKKDSLGIYSSRHKNALSKSVCKFSFVSYVEHGFCLHC